MPVFDSSQHFPSLYSDLVDVSADVYLEERSGEAYYKATLIIDEVSVNTLEQNGFQLVSGMPVDVIIKTGERTVFDYLLKPLRDMTVRAFNES
ncbi:MAG: hypothetical protein KZQ97_18510 [Candidatus Thiodiazotropha sp. (ex Dulcina madagascariensis)]|nr:hypothetical protein [Candidatus Thiodiazotropha sp. (ex Dulcina madagascariensis)]